MTDLHGLPPGLFDFLGRWQPPDPSTVPARICMHHDVWARILNDPRVTNVRFEPAAITPLFGLAVDLTNDIEPGTWQVYAADGTLLRDSRSTNEVRS